MIVYMAKGKNSEIYIGATSRNISVRRAEHKYHASQGFPGKFFDKIREYGSKYFNYKVLSKAKNKDKLFELEKYFIKLYDSYNNGLNGSVGGIENEGIIVTQKRIDCAKHQMKNIYLSGAIERARKNSLTPDKQRARGKIGNDNKIKKMPKYEIICKKTNKQVGIFQGYKEAAELLNINKNTIASALKRNSNSKGFIFRYLEVQDFNIRR